MVSDIFEERMLSLPRFLKCGVCGGSGAWYLRTVDGQHTPLGWCYGCKGTGYIKSQETDHGGQASTT